MRFSKVRRLFFPRAYGKSEVTLYSGLLVTSAPYETLFGAEKRDIGLESTYFWNTETE
jgi:hypothetical protein